MAVGETNESAVALLLVIEVVAPETIAPVKLDDVSVTL
jgi:hypothetical protein